MKNLTVASFCFWIVSLTMHMATATTTKTSQMTTPIEVSISTENGTVRLGDPITLRVKIHNRSEENLLVGRQVGTLMNAPFRLALSIQDATGKKVEQAQEDLVELPCLDLREKEDGMLKWWVPLSPDSSYTTTVPVHTRRLRGKLAPGMYRLGGWYRSFGMLEGGHCGPAKARTNSQQIAMRAWKGQVETNSIWIQIVQPDRVD